MEEKKLNRSLSPLNVWSIALGCIIGWGAFVMPGNLFLDSAGPLGTAIG
jgi:amino acid permease